MRWKLADKWRTHGGQRLHRIICIATERTTILTAQIRALYRELDKKYHLRGAQIPITFGFETDALGSYTRAGHHEKEHFHFSLLFVGYGVKNPLSKEDRMDLYKHEYAHYMEHHITIPREYQWQLLESPSPLTDVYRYFESWRPAIWV